MQHYWLGKADYLESLKVQEMCLRRVTAQGPQIMGLMYDKCITMGVRAKGPFDILVPESRLNEQGFSIHKSHRGGETTVHNLGQLVIYPLMPLHSDGVGTRCFVDLLQEATLNLLKQVWNIDAQKSCKNPGVYTKKGKIAFIGLKVSKGISSHGIAINIDNDLQDFSLIKSCGVREQSLDSVRTYVEEPLDIEDIFNQWVIQFSTLYRRMAGDFAN